MLTAMSSIANAKLLNSSINFNTCFIFRYNNLFNLSDATDYPTSSLTAQLQMLNCVAQLQTVNFLNSGDLHFVDDIHQHQQQYH